MKKKNGGKKEKGKGSNPGSWVSRRPCPPLSLRVVPCLFRRAVADEEIPRALTPTPRPTDGGEGVGGEPRPVEMPTAVTPSSGSLLQHPVSTQPRGGGTCRAPGEGEAGPTRQSYASLAPFRARLASGGGCKRGGMQASSLISCYRARRSISPRVVTYIHTCACLCKYVCMQIFVRTYGIQIHIYIHIQNQNQNQLQL